MKKRKQPVVNFTTKRLKDFVPNGDTIYIHKRRSGFDYNYYCRFLKYARGIVHAKVLWVDPPYISPSELKEAVTARPSSCRLYGREPGEPHDVYKHYNSATGGFGRSLDWSEGQITQERLLQVLADLYQEGSESYWGDPAKWARVLAHRLGLEAELREVLGKRPDVFAWEVCVSTERTYEVLARDEEEASRLVHAEDKLDPALRRQGYRRQYLRAAESVQVKRKLGRFVPKT